MGTKKNIEKLKVGKVEWFDEKKGYGFAKDDGGNLVFIHYTAIDVDQPNKRLEPDDEIQFYTEKDGDVTRAKSVRRIEV